MKVSICVLYDRRGILFFFFQIGCCLTLVMPPSTTKSVPLTKLASSLARKRTALACSMASPKRPVGKWISRRRRLALSSPSQSWRRGVLEGRYRQLSYALGFSRAWHLSTYLRGAGQRELKRKPSRAWTMASSRVMARTAPLEAV